MMLKSDSDVRLCTKINGRSAGKFQLTEEMKES